MSDAHLGDLVDGTDRNAVLAWIALGVLCLSTVVNAASGAYRWLAFSSFALVVVAVPAAAARDPRVMPPWELTALVAVPVVDASLFGPSVVAELGVYLAVAAAALLVAVEIHLFTAVRMNHAFAVALVVITTLAVAGAWNVAQWLSDLALGTQYLLGQDQDAANRQMMFNFVYAAVAGLIGGVVFDRYFRMRGDDSTGERTAPGDDSGRNVADEGDGDLDVEAENVEEGADDERAPDDESQSLAPSLIRGQFDVSEERIALLSRSMQVALAALLAYGLYARDVPTISNSAIALAVTFLPALLERDFSLPLEPELVFWLTGAAFLHTLGSAFLYDALGSWDSLTHVVSASVVAAAGYAIVRAVDLYTDEVYVPPKMTFAFILVFVLAVGVVWELFEFAVDQVALWLDVDTALAQHGVDDTVGDLLFDLVGGVVVALWGTVYLTDVAHEIAARLDGSSEA